MTIELALSLSAKGWPVFPCRSCESHDPLTGEVLAEKTPLTSNGFKSATRTERIIRRWWTDYPDAIIGIPTGAAIGAFVLDIDAKPGGANGFEWLAEIESEHGPLPDTLRVSSPNGGMHVYFNHVQGVRNRGALGAGVDIRGDGGYVLAGGSTMADGRSYAVINDARIADAPQWLLDLLLPKHQPSAQHYHPTSMGNVAYVQSAVDSELSDLASTPQGGRNNRLNDAAFALGQFIGAGVLSRSDAERELQAIAMPWGNFAKSCGTIRNGIEAGMKQPRHIPEQTHQDDNTRLVDISRMIANGLAKASKVSKSLNGDNIPDRDPDREVLPENDKKLPSGNTETPIDQPTNDNKPAIIATAFKWLDPRKLPRREFAFGTHYIRKYVSVTSSPGGLGKSSNSIVEVLSMTSGKALVGTKPEKPLRVWLFNAEDPRDEMERRIMAACIHYNLTPADIEGKLFLDTGREQELVVAIDDKKGVKIVVPIVEAVVEQIMRHQIDVMIIDPFVSTHSVNENDNGAIDKVAKLWANIADRTNCAVDVVHHLRKVSDREATVEDSRGAVSLLSAARSARVLNRMTDEQATTAGLDHSERFSMFSITYGKSNLTPMSHRLDWRKLEGVPLGNGQGLSKPQDHAPVVTEWKWPEKAETIDAITQDQMNAIAIRVNNTDCKMHFQAKNWVGNEVAYVMGWDASDKSINKKLRRMVDAWIDTGFLAVEQRRDPVKREMKDFVRAGMG